MVDAGILTENDRVELIRGEIVEKMSIGELHAACVKRINRFFAASFGERVCIGIQDPIRLAESEPEPDVSLLKPRSDDYAKSHPKPDEVLLLVEVADASLEFDRSIKSGVYAQNGIAEYWIVNLINRKLEVRRCPQPNGKYAEVQSLSIQDTVNLSAFPAIPFQVSELFPPAE
jgi:Uma2 family endonuclease